MDRTIYYTQEQLRSFDLLWFERDALISLGNATQDLLGVTRGVVAGLGAVQTTPASMVINLGAGRIYQQSAADSTAFGSIGTDTLVITQQGYAAAQTVTLTTSALSAGQGQWALICATFEQVDAIRANDPTGGVLYYYNSANPSQPFQGPGGDGATNNTVRQGLMNVSVVYGAPAASGSEVPPTAPGGSVGLYLVDITYGQTSITTAEILVAGPLVGPNVGSGYPSAPFLAGLLNSHHNGTNGQAPQIKLGSEVQGTLPLANMPASDTTGGLSVTKLYAGNPNGNLAGNANVNGASDFCYDTVDFAFYICTATGTSSTAVWSLIGSTTDIGVIKEYAGILAPSNHLFANGAAVSRTTYANLLSVITAAGAGTVSVSSNTITGLTTDYSQSGLIGAPFEATGVPSGAVISAVTSTTITWTGAAATISGAAAWRAFPWGNGDGSTTFNLPDKRERVSIGRGNMGGASDPGRVTTATISGGPTNLNATGGAETHVLTVAELATHSHGITDPGHSHGITDPTHFHSITDGGHAHSYVESNNQNDTEGGGSGGTGKNSGVFSATTGTSTTGITATNSSATFVGVSTATTGVSVQNQGSNTAHLNMQPTMVCNFVIRF